MAVCGRTWSCVIDGEGAVARFRPVLLYVWKSSLLGLSGADLAGEIPPTKEATYIAPSRGGRGQGDRRGGTTGATGERGDKKTNIYNLPMPPSSNIVGSVLFCWCLVVP